MKEAGMTVVALIGTANGPLESTISERLAQTGARVVRECPDGPAAITSAMNAHGRLDVLLDLSACRLPVASPGSSNAGNWDQSCGDVLTRIFRTARAAVPAIKAGNGGQILFGCPLDGAGVPGEASATRIGCSVQSALRGLVSQLAKELSPSRVAVNAWVPAVQGTPEELAATAAFLVSSPARRVSGQLLGLGVYRSAVGIRR
jgi:NAD(P)-dependent dehydrogenase (short-subunit alcohol dehydrogenase family)